MTPIRFHLPDSSVIEVTLENLDIPIVPLVKNNVPGFSLMHTMISWNANFSSILLIDKTTTVAELIREPKKSYDLELYLKPQPRFPVRLDGRRNATVPSDCGKSILFPDDEWSVFDEASAEPDATRPSSAPPNTPKSDTIMDSQMLATRATEYKNPQQLLIEEFGTSLIKLVSKQLGDSSDLLQDIVQSYSPQTDLDTYLGAIAEFIQTNIIDDTLQQQAQALIIEYAQKVAFLDENSPVSSTPSDTPENEFGALDEQQTLLLINATLTELTKFRSQSCRELAPHYKEKTVDIVTRQVTDSSRGRYETNQVRAMVLQIFDKHFPQPNTAAENPDGATSAPAATAPKSYLGFFIPLPHDMPAATDEAATPKASCNMDSVD